MICIFRYSALKFHQSELIKVVGDYIYIKVTHNLDTDITECERVYTTPATIHLNLATPYHYQSYLASEYLAQAQ